MTFARPRIGFSGPMYLLLARTRSDDWHTYVPCPRCNGTMFKDNVRCIACNGGGEVRAPAPGAALRKAIE